MLNVYTNSFKTYDVKLIELQGEIEESQLSPAISLPWAPVGQSGFSRGGNPQGVSVSSR